MKTKIKKTISLILSLCLLISVFSAAAVTANAADDGSECTCGNSPIIYVYGKQDIVDENGRDVLDEEQEDVAKAAAEITASFGISYLMNDWDSYNDTVYENLKPFYKEYALNKDGEVTNGTHVDFSWSEGTMKDTHHSMTAGDDGYIYPLSCIYKYDCRVDPVETAKDFNNFVECVKKVTKHTRVSIVARCLGTNIVTTYLSEYQAQKNYSGIDAVVLYAPTVMGVDLLDQLFCGKIKVEPSAVSKYSTELLPADAAPVKSLYTATMDLIYSAGITGGVTNFANDIIANLYEDCIPRLIRDTYATMPGFWSMVSTECYEQAKQYIFGNNMDKYAKLIEKTDYYKNNIQSKAADMYKEMTDKGVKLAIFAKYGLQMKPIVENCSMLSDDTISVTKQSFGATTTSVKGKLSDEYIASVKNPAYVSLDKQIDASTCLFPDRTWFVKDLEHSTFPDSINRLISYICTSKQQVTVNTYEQYPQFMKWTEKTGIIPLTNENSNIGHENDDVEVSNSESSMLTTLMRFLVLAGIWLWSMIKIWFDIDI